MRESKPRPPGPLLAANRCRSPARHLGKNKFAITKRNGLSSPLRTMETSGGSETVRRPALSARASVASRTSSLPASPLDDIPKKLWPRVLRTTTAPETSNPELSIDEITSTRLSLDDEAFLTNLPRDSDRKETQSRRLIMRTVFSGVWGEPNGRLKKMTKRLKRIPSGLFTRRERESTETMAQGEDQPRPPPEPLLPRLDLITELYIPNPIASSDKEESDGVNSEMPLVRCHFLSSALLTYVLNRWILSASPKQQNLGRKRFQRYDCK